jgi:hypothetical protein
MLQVFPYMLSRIASGRFEDFVPAQWNQVSHQLAMRNQLLAHKVQLQAVLNEKLYEIIKQTDDPKRQNALLQLKRDIYNNRTITPQRLAALESLSADYLSQVSEYIQINSQLAYWEQTFEKEYNTHLLTARAHLQNLSKSDELQKGLGLSSTVLLTQLSSYQRTPADQFRKKELQNELSLLRYLTRMHFKTSPFSTFTVVGLGIPAEVPQGIHLPRGPLHIQGTVRLNNYLFAYLKTLLTLQPSLQSSFSVRLNPSVRQANGDYHFLLNYNNVEAFQKLSGQALLDVLTQVLALHKGEMVLNQLVQTLIEDYVDIDPDDLHSFLLKLVEVGLLEFEVGSSGLDPDWDQALMHTLTCLPQSPQTATEVMRMLKTLRSLAEEYANGSVQNQVRLLEEAHFIFEQGCSELLSAIGLSHTELQQDKTYRERFLQQYESSDQLTIRPYLQAAFTPQMLYYEDVACRQETQIDDQALNAYLQTLTNFFEHFTCFETFDQERRKMCTHFISHYDTEAWVNVLDFYKSYYQFVKKPEKEKREQPSSPTENRPDEAITSEEQQNQQAWLSHFTTMLTKDLTDYQSILCIRLPQIAEAAAHSPKPQRQHRSTAMGAFIQFFTQPGEANKPALKGVVNSLFTGLGRSSGRFLHLFDAQVTHTLRHWNQRLHDEGDIMAELADASYFNANLHPPLLPYQIALPGGHSSLPPEACIRAAELEVRYSENEQQLLLVHTPSGKRVYPYDVCLQAFSTRSELYQLLTYFGSTRSYSFAPLIEAVSKLYQTRFESHTYPFPGISKYPRIQLEQHIILQRQRWYVQKEALPLREKNETDGQYFLRLNEWRWRLGMPDEIFICVNPNGLPISEQETTNARRDDYKPQYIHFTNPLLVRLFEKQLEKVVDVLRLEEMLPDTRTLGKQQTEYISEMLVEWYNLHPQSQLADIPDTTYVKQ